MVMNSNQTIIIIIIVAITTSNVTNVTNDNDDDGVYSSYINGKPKK